MGRMPRYDHKQWAIVLAGEEGAQLCHTKLSRNTLKRHFDGDELSITSASKGSHAKIVFTNRPFMSLALIAQRLQSRRASSRDQRNHRDGHHLRRKSAFR